MIKPISRFMHGLADYGYAATIAFAPELSGFEEEETAVTACRVLGAGTLLVSLLTRYEFGLFKVLPFKAHLAADVLTGSAAIAAPWALGFEKNNNARHTFVGLGVLTLIIVALTRAEEMN